MPWIIALEMARRNAANRALASANRQSRRERIQKLSGNNPSEKVLDSRYIDRSTEVIMASIGRVRSRSRKERTTRIIKTCIAFVVLVIIAVAGLYYLK